MLRPGHYCFYIDESMKTDHGYVPSIVEEDIAGYSPLAGNGHHATPWYWGDTLDAARAIAAEQNAKLGLTPADVERIVDSSIVAGVRARARKLSRNN
jgi:hypothetical protein